MALFARPLHAAKFNPRLTPRLLRRHPRGYLRRSRLLQMKPEFLVEFALSPALRESLPSQKAPIGEEFLHHAVASALRPSTNATAADSRSQLSSSVSNCFLPAAVSA